MSVDNTAVLILAALAGALIVVVACLLLAIPATVILGL